MERNRAVAGRVCEQRRSDGERLALNSGALTWCVRLVVCQASGCLLREELRERQAVKLLLRMVPPGLWGQFPATEQRMVPPGWDVLPSVLAVVGQLWRGVRGMQGCVMPSG